MKSITVVLLDAAIEETERLVVNLVSLPVVALRVNVTPVGILLNVRRICVLLSVAVPEVSEFSVAVRQQLAQPSEITNAPDDFPILPLVRRLPVPGVVLLPLATPIERLEMPAARLEITVPLEGVPST